MKEEQYIEIREKIDKILLERNTDKKINNGKIDFLQEMDELYFNAYNNKIIEKEKVRLKDYKPHKRIIISILKVLTFKVNKLILNQINKFNSEICIVIHTMKKNIFKLNNNIKELQENNRKMQEKIQLIEEQNSSLIKQLSEIEERNAGVKNEKK